MKQSSNRNVPSVTALKLIVFEYDLFGSLGSSSCPHPIGEEVVAMAARGQHHCSYRSCAGGRLDADRRHSARWDSIRRQGTSPESNISLNVLHQLKMLTMFLRFCAAPPDTPWSPWSPTSRNSLMLHRWRESILAWTRSTPSWARWATPWGTSEMFWTWVVRYYERYLSASAWHATFVFLSELMFLYLDDEVPPSEVVNKVAAIMSQSGNAAGQELYSLLESSDIDRCVHLTVLVFVLKCL